MSKGEDLVLTDRGVWNVYSPNPPIINWITDSKISIITRRITASDTSEKFKYIGIDMFMGYGPYNSSPFLPYESVSIMGYWNDFAGMNKYLDQSNPGDWVEFVIDFRYLNDHHGGDFVLDYNRKPISCPYGIPGVQGGTRMNYNDLYKIFKVTGAIYFRVWHRTRWACESESAKVTDVGYIYSGYVDNFQHPTVGHTFEGGVCIYPYRPLVYVLYDKANENMSLKVYAPMTFRQHGERGYWEKPDYVPNNNTKWDIAITASIVGEGSPNPGMSGQYGPGEHEIFRRVFTKSNNDRWVNTTFNKRLDEVFPNRRGQRIAFRVWYNANINGWGWTGWETTGPDPSNRFEQCLLAEEKCFPTMYYNRLPVMNYETSSSDVRNNTVYENIRFRWMCRDDDNDMFDFVSDVYVCNSHGGTAAHHYGWFNKSMSSGNYDETKSQSVTSILNMINPNVPATNYYNHHFELPATSADRFDAHNSNGSFAETITSPRQNAKIVSPYTIDFRPTNLSINFDKTVGDEFTATINGVHPDWENCKFYLSVRDEDEKWEQHIKGSWGVGGWQAQLARWEKGHVVRFNLASLYGESYRGKRFKVYYAVISPHGWDTHAGWTGPVIRLNDRPRMDLSLNKPIGPTVYGEVSASDQDGVSTVNVEFCLANNNNGIDTSKMWRKSYTIHGEAYVNIVEEITPKLNSFGINTNSYIGKKVFVRAGAVDRLGCERAPSDMAWKEMIYDVPAQVSMRLENRKGEEAFIIISTTYPNGLPIFYLSAECPGGVEKQVYNNLDNPAGQGKEIRIRFSPIEHGFKDPDRGKTFKFRAEVTNTVGGGPIIIKTDNWTWNDIPRVQIQDVIFEKLNNGLFRTGCGTLKPTFKVMSSDSDNMRVIGDIGDDNTNNNLKNVLNDSINAGTTTKDYTIDLQTYFKNHGVEFNFKTFRVKTVDVYNKTSSLAISRNFRMLDGHKINVINIEPSSLSANTNNNISGKNFNVRVRFEDTPYAKSNASSVLDLQLYIRNMSKARILYIQLQGLSSYLNYLKEKYTVTHYDKTNDRNYVTSLTYDNIKNSYDLVIFDCANFSLSRAELLKAKELADNGMPCYVIGNDTNQDVFATGSQFMDYHTATNGEISSRLPFANNKSSVSLSTDAKNYYLDLHDSVFPIVTHGGKHVVFCYSSRNVTATNGAYEKTSYVIQDNDYGISRDFFEKMIEFLLTTKKDRHRRILSKSLTLSNYDSGHICKPTDILVPFDGAELHLNANDHVFAKARIRTFVVPNWDGDFYGFFEESDKDFIYAPEPDKPSVRYPVSASNSALCLKNPPIYIIVPNQSNPANGEIADVRVKWNNSYYYASAQTSNFSITISNYNNTALYFFPPNLLTAGHHTIEVAVKSKLTNIWSPSTIFELYIKDISVIRNQGNIVQVYAEPRIYIDELRRAYGMGNYSYPSTSSGSPITYENHLNVLNKAFNELVDHINSGCTKKDWCTHMNVPNQLFILSSSTTIINNFLTKFNK